LRERVPENAFLYARIPALWSLASFKDDSFKYAMGNEAYLAEMKKLRQATGQWLQKADPAVAPLLTLLNDQMDGPLEMVGFSKDNQPVTLLSGNVRFKSEDDVKRLIGLLIQQGVVAHEMIAYADGAGVLNIEGMPVSYRWDQTNNRLNMMASLAGSDIAGLDQLIASLQENPASPMLLNEKQMDDSQQGLYLWFNNQQAAAVYNPMLPQDIAFQMAAMGVPHMKSLAASWGVSNGKGRLKVQLDAPHKGMIRQVVPINSNQYPIKTAGNPGLVFTLSTPSHQEFQRLETLAGGHQHQDYQELKQQFFEQAGYAAEDWLKAVGPELALVSDESGEYLAVRIRDKAQFDLIMTAIKAQPTASFESRSINGVTISHLKLPGFVSEEELAEDDMPEMVRDMLTRIGSHFYWQEEDGFLIIADLPQVLLDRQAKLSDQTLQQWLTEHQRQDLSGSLLAFSADISNAPRRIYYAYLNAIQAMGDLTGARQDLFGLPTAGALNLPNSGSYGFQFDSSADKLAAEFVFESTPADILLAGEGAGAIAAVGVLAAVAIPAYQDYTIRAEVSGAYFEAFPIQQELEGFYQLNGRFPNEDEVLDLLAEDGNNFYLIEVEPETGVIFVELRGNEQIDGELLVIEPDPTNYGIQWYCGSDIGKQYLPASCR